MKLSSQVKYRSEQKIPSQYQCALFDSSVKVPFLITDELMKRMDILKKQTTDMFILSHEIYTYLHDQIAYGFVNKKRKGYGTSTEVWENKEGICGEMSFLYTTLARYCGIPSACVEVNKDFRGKRVHHMCSQVEVPDPILVDIAYNQFDIVHKKYHVVSDAEVLHLFSQWRK